MAEYCKRCGTEHTDVEFPKKCVQCNLVTYTNPLLVGTCIIPVVFPLGTIGLLIGRRGNTDDWGLIGGYVELSDKNIEHGSARELEEETGIVVDPDSLKMVSSYNNGTHMMVFCELNRPIEMTSVLSQFKRSDECGDIRVILEPEKLCFPSHTEAVKTWFERMVG